MESNKKLAIIGTVGLPALYGGFETLAAHLVDNLSDEYDITVYCSRKKYKKEDRKPYYKNAKLKFIPFEANGMQSIIYDSISIIHSLFYSDVLLIFGVAGAWILPFVKLFTNKKIIVSINGIEWKRDKWSRLAKWYLFWVEKVAVKYSHIDILDNESIQDYTSLRYGRLSHIIEYGADHAICIKPDTIDRHEYPFLNMPYAFKVCHIEPENNVHEVLNAFAELPRHILVIVGNWEKSQYGINLKSRYCQYSNIFLLNSINDQRRFDLIRGNAFAYVHGHAAGGTNPALVEAMYLGQPVIAFGVSYNRTTTENKALYFNNYHELKELIQQTPVRRLKEIGEVMKEIALRRYTWKFICNKYKALINESLEGVITAAD